MRTKQVVSGTNSNCFVSYDSSRTRLLDVRRKRKIMERQRVRQREEGQVAYPRIYKYGFQSHF